MKTKMKQLAFVLLALFFFVACDNAKKDKDVIKIGAVLPLTGSAAEMGVYSKEGLLLAIKEINNKGGGNLESLSANIQDSKSQIKDGVSATNLLFLGQDTPNVVFSQLSGIGIAISEVTKKHPIVHFSMSATPDFYSASPFNIRNYVSSEAISKKAFEYINKNKVTNIVIVEMESDYSKPIADSLAKYLQNVNLSFEIIKFAPDLTDAKNLSLQIENKLRTVNDLVFLTGYGAILGNIAKELNNRKFSGTLLVEPTFNIPANTKHVNNLKYPVQLIDIAFDSENPKSLKEKEFCNAYYKEYKKLPKLSSALVYESLYLWKYGYEKTNSSDANTLINFLESQRTFNGKIFDSITVSDRNINFPLTLRSLVNP